MASERESAFPRRKLRRLLIRESATRVSVNFRGAVIRRRLLTDYVTPRHVIFSLAASRARPGSDPRVGIAIAFKSCRKHESKINASASRLLIVCKSWRGKGRGEADVINISFAKLSSRRESRPNLLLPRRLELELELELERNELVALREPFPIDRRLK